MEKKRSYCDGPSSAGRISFSRTSRPNLTPASADATNRPGRGPWPPRTTASLPVSNWADRRAARSGVAISTDGGITGKILSNPAADRARIALGRVYGACRGRQEFGPRAGMNFATFARHRIKGCLRDYLRRMMSESWRKCHEASPRGAMLRPRIGTIRPNARVVGREACRHRDRVD